MKYSNMNSTLKKRDNQKLKSTFSEAFTNKYEQIDKMIEKAYSSSSF